MPTSTRSGAIVPRHRPTWTHRQLEQSRLDRHYLYNPATLSKIIEIYRFKHNWMGSRATTETPAMRIGLAAGKIYERDLFS